MQFTELNEENFLLFAIKHYENPHSITREDFEKGDAATPMLFFKIDANLWSIMKTFIVFLNRLPDIPRTVIHDIELDQVCLKELEKIADGKG